ncbi:MAG: FAD-dependent oxidoreductase, partial [Nanoarchaeota archaeon]
FLVPIYTGKGDSKFMLRIGMLLYEALSGFQNFKFHRFLSREDTLTLAPGIPSEGLEGGVEYYDAEVSDNRWTMEIIKDGVRNGGVALNYAPITGLMKSGGLVSGVTINDTISGKQHHIRARCVINATGVATDSIRAMDGQTSALVRLSKGTHLVFKEEDVPITVTTVFNSPIDGRPLFLAKHEGAVLYGTTDDYVEDDPGAPMPAKKDCDYLLKSLALFMPSARLDRRKVQFAYSGFRPLIKSGSTSVEASREDLIETSLSGLISVVGGKLTTARIMATRVLDTARPILGTIPGKCLTGKLSIGGTNKDVAEGLLLWVKRYPPLASYFTILFQRYGTDAQGICEQAMLIHSGQHPDPTAEPIRAEVQYVCRNEMVCTLQDLIERRAGFLYWNAAKRLERLQHGKKSIMKELDLTDKEFERQYDDYKTYLAKFHALPK